ncbi:hypothetical protein CSA80_01500 [Candidatus Saccharibacteria bacterium]|nr:MAG: hypothetical protein CSA80_01500 [Candidatus Saccharibacteria bacterium]
MKSNKIQSFIESQKSLQYYERLREAIADVLSSVSDNEFERITRNVLIVALHDGASAQVMHVPPQKEQLAVVQITLHSDATDSHLRYVVAHEFGHVLQGRNWEESDGDSLEEDAHAWAVSHGFEDTRKTHKAKTHK